MYVVDMSAWATADRNYTLPATAAVGDRVGVIVSAGDAAHELILKANTGDTLNGVSAAEWSRLFITGECVIMRCITANATWIVEYDGRIPQKALMRLSTAATAETASAWTAPTTKSGAWTADINIGSLCDTSNDQVTPRRLGKYNISAGWVANSTASAADKTVGLGLYLNGTGGTLITNSTYGVPASGMRGFSFAALLSYPITTIGDDITYSFFTEEGSRGALASSSSVTQRCFLAVVEVLRSSATE